MQIPPITNQKLTFVKRLKNMFSKYKLKLKTLTKDVFEKRNNKYIEFDGKKMRERDLPNYVTGPSDINGGITWGEIKFYPEDEAIIKTIKDPRERIEFQSKLIRSGKFIE